MVDPIPNFYISGVDHFGDPTEGESQIVTLSHICQGLLIPIQLQTNFSKFLKDEKKVVCPNCLGSTRVLKQNGRIFTAA